MSKAGTERFVCAAVDVRIVYGDGLNVSFRVNDEKRSLRHALFFNKDIKTPANLVGTVPQKRNVDIAKPTFHI